MNCSLGIANFLEEISSLSYSIVFLYFFALFTFFFNFIFKLHNTALALPNIETNPPQAYPRSPSWTLLPPPSPALPLGRMFIAALFIIARTWNQPRCPSADEWIRKLWYIYTMEYYSAIKKNIFESVLMRWMKLEPIIQSEVSQKEKHQYSILMHIYGI